jgi:ElaB/YqjD/DUF883 family membrane-anchored ribosome-binding protein
VFSSNKDDKSCADDAWATTAAHEAGQKLRVVMDKAELEARDVTAAVVSEVRKNPLQSSAIAAGVGLLLGLLLRRR